MKSLVTLADGGGGLQTRIRASEKALRLLVQELLPKGGVGSTAEHHRVALSKGESRRW